MWLKVTHLSTAYCIKLKAYTCMQQPTNNKQNSILNTLLKLIANNTAVAKYSTESFQSLMIIMCNHAV